MKHIPKIIFKIDLDKETETFYSFLHHKYFVGHRDKILKIFPALEKMLDDTDDEREVIKIFLEKYYEDNNDKMDEIVTKNKSLIAEKSNEALLALADLMDYEWKKGVTYYAIPTILPFSPFKDNTFFLSILGQLKGQVDDTKNALSVSIHEISHFIFFDQLEKLQKENSISKDLSKDLIHYYKESLTAVLLNEESLAKILEIKNYKGNPELWNLNIKVGDKTMNINYHLKDLYRKLKNEKSFEVFLKESINSLIPYSQELGEKWKLWSQSRNRQEIVNDYSKPILMTRKN